GKNFAQQSSLVHQFERTPGMAFGQHSSDLVADALARDLMNLRRQLLNCSKRSWLNRVFKSGRKANRTQHTQLVFGEAKLRIAEGANNSSFQIILAAHKIQNIVLDWI